MSSEPPRSVRAAKAVRRDVALIRQWIGDKDFTELRRDILLRYAIERAFIAIDAALRDIPQAMLLKYDVPSQLVADFRNVLAHTYDDALDARAIITIRNDLPLLDRQITAILVEMGKAGG